MEPVRHLLKAGYGASIIAIQDATECGERGLEKRKNSMRGRAK
jgi:hypothetical protein